MTEVLQDSQTKTKTFSGNQAVLLTRTLVQGPGQGQGLESEGQAPRQ